MNSEPDSIRMLIRPLKPATATNVPRKEPSASRNSERRLGSFASGLVRTYPPWQPVGCNAAGLAEAKPAFLVSQEKSGDEVGVLVARMCGHLCQDLGDRRLGSVAGIGNGVTIRR